MSDIEICVDLANTRWRLGDESVTIMPLALRAIKTILNMSEQVIS